MKIVMVTGGRKYDDREYVEYVLQEHNSPGNILVVGGATGADELVRQVWHYDFQLPYVVEPAPWDRTGKPAGIMRNMSMVNGMSLVPHGGLLTPSLVVAFPGGRGTAHARSYAIERGIEVEDV